MQGRLKLFSDFVQDLNHQARTEDSTAVLNWATRELSDILGFDSAWYGWAQICPEGPIIHANATLNLPEGYFASWSEMSSEDLLVAQFQANPCQVPTYDRGGRVHTDGMQHLSDTFGLKKMATAMNLREGRSASLWLSAYRGGSVAKAWTEEECEFLQYAIDHVAVALRLAKEGEDRGLSEDACTVLINEKGVVLLGLETVLARFGHLWTRADGDRLPRCLAEYFDQPGEHILIDRGLVATYERAPERNGLNIMKLSLRPLTKFDLLTKREQAVAALLADGNSHKEAAQLLGVAPSTVRNQTQSIYEKLSIDNRASLAALVSSRVPIP